MYAADGFDAAEVSAVAPDVRTVVLDSKKPPRVFVELDVPSAWHMRSMSSVASFPPWDYALHPERNPAVFLPGETAIDAARFGVHDEVTTLDAAADSLTYYEELPISLELESVMLDSGHEAILATAAFESDELTALFIDDGEGILGLYCYGDQAPSLSS